MIIFFFSLVFQFSVYNIYIANIVYYIFLVTEIIKNNRITVIKNKIAFLFYILFIFWVTISTYIYTIETSNMTARVMIQYLFTLQYFVLIVPIKMEEKNFELWVYRFAILKSLLIIMLFLYFSIASPNLLLSDLWAVNYIPGWPNTTPIPLLIGLWLLFKNKKSVINKMVIYLALFLTKSRIAIFGGIIISFYSLISKIKFNKMNAVILVMMAILLIIGTNYWITVDPSLITKMTVSEDRIDIFNTSMHYLKNRPLLGYGGNTLDQLCDIEIGYQPVKNWGHTHNWILEILLRYGIIGTLFFSGYIIAIYVSIKNKEKRFMFAFLLILALFQTYIRDFVFIFYMLFLSMETHCYNKAE